MVLNTRERVLRICSGSQNLSKGVRSQRERIAPAFHMTARTKAKENLKRSKIVFFLSLTMGSVFVHGYHPWAEDAAIYLPGVEKLLNQKLFPFNAQFFESHARLTLFPELIAASIRITQLRPTFAFFLWHLTSIFLLLYACWELAAKCFHKELSRYTCVLSVAALLTLPIAGTALYIMDQYLNPRNLAAFACVLAVAKMVDKKYIATSLLLILGLSMHPLMGAFASCFCFLLFHVDKYKIELGFIAGLLPLGLLDPPGYAYHRVAVAHSYFYPLRWHWYEWCGVIGPILFLAWFGHLARLRRMDNLALVCRTLVIYQILFTIIALIISGPQRLEMLVRLQPMRSLFLLYILVILFSGGLLCELALKDHWWRWIVLFLPLCAMMFYAQRALFPNSMHIEWPGVKQRNLWGQAFEWIQRNTPPDAVFALDPEYMNISGEDEISFRALAQRSTLADEGKDRGAVSMFPALADEWLRQVRAQRGWQSFQLQDFRRLQAEYGVGWVVLQQPALRDLRCPYQNQAVAVCTIPGTPP